MMTDDGNFWKKTVLLIFGPLISLGVVIWFWPSRWVHHNVFLFRLKNPHIKPGLFSLPFVFLYLAGSMTAREFRRRFSRYALKKYTIFTPRHYAKGGLGYSDGDKISDEDRDRLYLQERGRIAFFIDHNRALVPYKNGDSFLDVGCGKGQNIRVISERYAASKISGFDISEDALKIIRCGAKNNPNISVAKGDICSREFLSSIPDESVNHVIVSHVLGFLSGPGIEETKKFRQEIVDELIRIASDSVIILDMIENAPEIRVEIEQNNRCIVHDRLMDYFFPYTTSEKGEVYAMFSNESSGLLYLKRKKNSTLHVTGHPF